VDIIIDHFGTGEGLVGTINFNKKKINFSAQGMLIWFNLGRLFSLYSGSLISDVSDYLANLGEVSGRLVTMDSVLEGFYFSLDGVKFYDLLTNHNSSLSAGNPPTGGDPILELFPPTLNICSLSEIETEIHFLTDFNFSTSKGDLDILFDLSSSASGDSKTGFKKKVALPTPPLPSTATLPGGSDDLATTDQTIDGLDSSDDTK